MKTYTPNQSVPENRGKKEFYIEEDWRLPMAFQWFDTDADAKLPPFAVQMWFKGQAEAYNTEAFIYHQGKLVGSQKANEDAIIETHSAGDLGTWKLYTFRFYKVRSVADESAFGYYNVANAFYISKNPGEYEIKVLRSGKLARQMTFTVGQDGKVVDNQIAANNNLGGIRKLFSVKVSGDQEPENNSAAWQTEMLYGNKINGFVTQ